MNCKIIKEYVFLHIYWKLLKIELWFHNRSKPQDIQYTYCKIEKHKKKHKTMPNINLLKLTYIIICWEFQLTIYVCLAQSCKNGVKIIIWHINSTNFNYFQIIWREIKNDTLIFLNSNTLINLLLWNLIKDASVSNILDNDGAKLTDKKDIVQQFNTFFSNVGTEISMNIKNKPPKIINLINKRKDFNSYCNNSLTNIILKRKANFISYPLSLLFNISIKKGTYHTHLYNLKVTLNSLVKFIFIIPRMQQTSNLYKELNLLNLKFLYYKNICLLMHISQFMKIILILCFCNFSVKLKFISNLINLIHCELSPLTQPLAFEPLAL
ncbi:Reverse transcriptase domain-containing protein [Aphis craccivora]|uniref:Reverse transcriptase domain-containing protein n=1 Tax=Aphis craccivora TaxID=307492 RepID=A0A6G0ZEJ8_APHCR|nr:Reverse transcriptase domain-containing protein [Aphis craccivora]